MLNYCVYYPLSLNPYPYKGKLDETEVKPMLSEEIKRFEEKCILKGME